MEDTDILGKGFTRRDLLKITAGGIAGSVLTLATQKINALTSTNKAVSSVDQPSAQLAVNESAVIEKQEQLSSAELTMYGDLTPGIGISVAWMGTTSSWNTIVENIITATHSVGVAPYVFVPKHLEADFQTHISKIGMQETDYHMIVCDAENRLSDDSVDMKTGEATKPTVKKGFHSPWIRDWGTMVGMRGEEMVQLNTRKNGMPDPLQGVPNVRNMSMIDPGLKFDGGAYFEFITENGSLCIASENEMANNNSWNFSKGVNPKDEAVKRLKETFGEKTKIILLPSLKGNSVDHVDIQVLPVGVNSIMVGEALIDDINYSILQKAAETVGTELNVSRLPVRRIGDNIVSWVNGLPHITGDGRKIIFMPVYDGYEQENNQAELEYEKLGFEVVPVNSTSTMKTGGSIHCATNTSMTAALIETI